MAAEQKFYFETLKKSFADVTVTDAGVNTDEFLQASEDLVRLFDLFNSTAFSVVQNDLTGNIKKIRTYRLAHPDTTETLEQLIDSERNEKKRDATQGLLWLLRGLHFTAVSLRDNLSNPSSELSESFRKGYQESLRPHHNMLVRGVFSVAMNACPYRKDFYQKLGPSERVDPEMQKWLSALETIVAKLQAYYKSTDAGKGL